MALNDVFRNSALRAKLGSAGGLESPRAASASRSRGRGSGWKPKEIRKIVYKKSVDNHTRKKFFLWV